MNQLVACSIFLSSLFIPGIVHAQVVNDNISVKSSNANTSQPKIFGLANEEILAADPRLSKQKVSLVNKRIYLSELMKQWTEQTGIAFEARDDGKDTSGRWRVMIALRDGVTIADAMDALRSALSEQGATWQWERGGDALGYNYRLVAPVNQVLRNQELRRKIQNDFEGELDTVKGALKMTPEELKKAAADDPTGTCQSLLDYPEVREGIAAFISNVPQDQQQAMLRGEMGVLTLPFASLDEAGKKFALNRTQENVQRNAKLGATMESEMPTRIIIRRAQAGNKSTPSLLISVGNDIHASGGAYLGGNKMEDRWRDQLARGVLLSDDSKQSKKYAQVMDAKIEPDTKNASSKYIKPDWWFANHATEYHLMQLAESSSPRINFIACLPQSYGSWGNQNIYGQTLDWLRKEIYTQSVASKWQHDILLFHYTAGFTFHDTVVNVPTYAFTVLIKERQNEWVKQKVVPVSDLVTLGKMGTEEQWNNYKTEYGSAFSFLEQLSPVHYLFALMGQESPEVIGAMLSPQGAQINTLSPKLLKALEVPSGTPMSARIVCGDNQKLSQAFIGTNKSRVIWILVLDGEDASFVPNRMASASQGGILKDATYTIPQSKED